MKRYIDCDEAWEVLIDNEKPFIFISLVGLTPAEIHALKSRLEIVIEKFNFEHKTNIGMIMEE